MRFKTVHPKELGPAEFDRWRAHLRPGFDSPYLTPEWAQLIGETRDDARVCIINDGEAFLGAQRLSRFAAMGLGAPIADYQGIVGAPDLEVDSGALCRALKVGRLDLSHSPTGQTLFKAAGSEGSWIVATDCSRDLYEAGLKSRRGEFVRQTGKKARKLARERGHVEFRAQSSERADFETLVQWKNSQLQRSGQPEIWATPWVRQTIDACFEQRSTQFGGALFTMHVDGQMVAGAFCLRSPRVLHFWIVAHDSAFDSFSPGVQLARWAIGWAGEQGIPEVDFGPGDYQFKRQLSTAQRPLEWGVVSGGSLSGMLRQSQHALRAGIERLPQPKLAALPGKAMRRLDLMRALAA